MGKPDLVAGASTVLIAGPTASGKSAMALLLAERHDGVVINADSMQVYRELRVLTARPTEAEEARAPHRLYGHVGAASRHSVGKWLEDVAAVLDEARAAGRLPIFVGGTGLYFKALTEGIAPVPEIPEAVRAEWRERGAREHPAALHRLLAERDAEGAAAVGVTDRARIVRALEVVEGTGRPLREWQRQSSPPLIEAAEARRIVLAPDRAVLGERIDLRLARMVEEGAVAEAAALARLGLPPDLPSMKAIGVGEFADHAAGRISLDMALRKVRTETRRYAKRQMTWFRNQMTDWTVLG